MGEGTKISWTDNTFNPWIGCTQVDECCNHCYAETLMADRYGRVKWGKGQDRSRTSEANWKLPFKWNRQAEERRVIELHSVPAGVAHAFNRPRVFCASLADWLDDDNVPIEWFVGLLRLIHDTPNLNWLLLTKRLENWRPRLSEAIRSKTDGTGRGGEFWQWMVNWLGGKPPENVWLGVSAGMQKHANKRRSLFEAIPAKVKFVSYEPALEAVDWTGWEFVDQLIIGGESGMKARRFHLEWALSAVEWCRRSDVKPFFKQTGSNAFLSGQPFVTQHKKGEAMAEWPESLRVQEVP